MTEFGKKPDVVFDYDMGPGRSAKEIVKTSNVEATPQMGTRMAKSDNYDDALRQNAGVSKIESVTTAPERMGAAKRALDLQLNRGTATGGNLGDPTTRQQSGTNFKEGME